MTRLRDRNGKFVPRCKDHLKDGTDRWRGQCPNPAVARVRENRWIGPGMPVCGVHKRSRLKSKDRWGHSRYTEVTL